MERGFLLRPAATRRRRVVSTVAPAPQATEQPANVQAVTPVAESAQAKVQANGAVTGGLLQHFMSSLEAWLLFSVLTIFISAYLVVQIAPISKESIAQKRLFLPTDSLLHRIFVMAL